MTFPKAKLDERTWLATDAAQRDAIGSNDALEVGEECITEDNGFRFRCLTIPGGDASTWVKTGTDVLLDTFGNALTTGNATGGGGSVDFTIPVTNAGESFGKCILNQLRLVANGTCADATLRLYRDAARTDEIYAVLNVDPTVQFVDRNTCQLRGDDGSLLENQTIYGRVFNNDAVDSTFDIEVELWG